MKTFCLFSVASAILLLCVVAVHSVPANTGGVSVPLKVIIFVFFFPLKPIFFSSKDDIRLFSRFNSPVQCKFSLFFCTYVVC